MLRTYKTVADVENHMKELIAARCPFKGTNAYGEWPFPYIGIPVKCGNNLWCRTLQFANGQKSNGRLVAIEWVEFQSCVWEPVNLPREQWEHLLTEEAN